MEILSKEHFQRSRQCLAEKYGIEVTPEEYEKRVRQIFAKLREGLHARGWRVPDSDEGLFWWMELVLREPKKGVR